MKKIIHLSDLHFGTQRPGIVNILIDEINALKPDIIVVSGDLTQRAKVTQFKETKQFLDNINQNGPILCVPGNHDISLYNLIERFFYPFKKYKKWIAGELCHYCIQDKVVILGINSVTPFKPMSGHVTDKQLKMVKEFFSQFNNDMIKIVVMHHNLISSERHIIINNSDKIINLFAECNVNLVLSGHIHFACIETLKNMYEKKLYVITAGTAISTRTTYPNSFNIIEIGSKGFSLEVCEFNENKFDLKEKIYFSY